MNRQEEFYYIHPKDKDGKYYGITICVLVRDGVIFHGQATCSKEEQFNKKIGRELSHQRAEDAYQKNKTWVTYLSNDGLTKKSKSNKSEKLIKKINKLLEEFGD
jgi:hypothetical protein